MTATSLASVFFSAWASAFFSEAFGSSLSFFGSSARASERLSANPKTHNDKNDFIVIVIVVSGRGEVTLHFAFYEKRHGISCFKRRTGPRILSGLACCRFFGSRLLR